MNQTLGEAELKTAVVTEEMRQLLTATALTLPTTGPARNTTTKAHTTHAERKARTQTAKRDRRRNRS